MALTWRLRLSALTAVAIVWAASLVPRHAAAMPQSSSNRVEVSAEVAATAKREFARGQHAFMSGDYRQAGEAFEAAYRSAPHHAPLWNAARAWQKAGENARAANLFARYLREAPADAPDRGSATSALAELATQLGRITYGAPGARRVTVDGGTASGGEVYVLPGTHGLEAEGTPSGNVRGSCEVQAGKTVHVSLQGAASTVAPMAPEPATTAAATTTDARRKPWSPWVVVAGGVLTAGAGAFTIASGVETNNARKAFDADPTQAQLDHGKSLQTRTNVALGATVGFAVLTGLAAVFFVDFSGASPSGVRGVAVGPGTVELRGRF